MRIEIDPARQHNIVAKVTINGLYQTGIPLQGGKLEIPPLSPTQKATIRLDPFEVDIQVPGEFEYRELLEKYTSTLRELMDTQERLKFERRMVDELERQTEQRQRIIEDLKKKRPRWKLIRTETEK